MYQMENGSSWHRQASGLQSLESVPRADALWSKLEGGHEYTRDILINVGGHLGEWLFDQRSRTALEKAVLQHREGAPSLRIELHIPEPLSDWPWEALALGGIGHLAVHQALSIVRIVNRQSQPLAPSRQLTIDLVGVSLDSGRWGPLKAGQELDLIRNEIERAGSRGRFTVRADYQGSWERQLQRGHDCPVSHVFHFAGHGMVDGRGLIFRGQDGGPFEVDATMLAQELAYASGDRRPRLVYLSACTTASVPRAYQPFGGLAQQLIQNGICMVVSMHVPLRDHEALELAAAFYGALARGIEVDCALQIARRQVYSKIPHGIAWAFTSLISGGPPQPLFRDSDNSQDAPPDGAIWEFGFPAQRNALRTLILRRSPTVIVITGVVGSGHRHIVGLVQHDLEAAGQVLWRPVATMRWFVPGERELSRGQLLAGIARALEISDQGTQEELMRSLAQVMARRCGDKTLVIDLAEVVVLFDQAHADALIVLVRDLFVELMEQAKQYRSTLPIFLLVAVGEPRPRQEPARSGEYEAVLTRTQTTLARLAAEKLLKKGQAKVRIEVLSPLEPIDKAYVETFLDRMLDLETDQAYAYAGWIVGIYDDNDAILARMRRYIEEHGV